MTLRKKICFFATNYDFTRQRLIEYYENLLGEKADLYLFSTREDIQKFKTQKFTKAGYNGKKYLAWSCLRKFCKEKEIDVVVGFSGSGDVSATILLATIFSKTRYIAHRHGNIFWSFADMIKLGIIKESLMSDLKGSFFLISQLFMKKMLICAPDIKKKLARIHLMSRNIHYLPSAIDTEFYRTKSKKNARIKFGFKEDDKIIISVGRISYLKGSDFLFELVKKNPDKKFVFLGSVDDKRFEHTDFKNVLIRTATGEELVDYYNASDLGIFLSRTEGNPFAARECMACGIPTIVLDIESVRLFAPAIKVPPKLIIIQNAVDKFFLKSKQDKKILGEESRKFIVDNYSFENLRKDYKKAFLD